MNTPETLGARIARLRKEKKMTQDEIAERLNVSPQAVSKWENDQSCPDILLLTEIADLFGITTDVLLRGESAREPDIKILPPEKRKDFNRMLLRIKVDSSDGDIVRVNLPMALLKVAFETGMKMPGMKIGDTDCANVLESIDLGQIITLVEQGVIGKLVEVQSSDGDTVEIAVE